MEVRGDMVSAVGIQDDHEPDIWVAVRHAASGSAVSSTHGRATTPERSGPAGLTKLSLTLTVRAEPGGAAATSWTALALGRAVAGGCSRAVQALGRERRERRIAAYLQALDDRILKDIGIDRGEITFVARQLASARRPRITDPVTAKNCGGTTK